MMMLRAILFAMGCWALAASAEEIELPACNVTVTVKDNSFKTRNLGESVVTEEKEHHELVEHRRLQKDKKKKKKKKKKGGGGGRKTFTFTVTRKGESKRCRCSVRTMTECRRCGGKCCHDLGNGTVDCRYEVRKKLCKKHM
eukprot:CAMPEP_0183327882 /NCGR_PEP_ID=MMETSP0160_2-20130417/83993_1 /TAXON_ID=2839 ORGANISM="Odontella Sinensis, Strain Grunow 1884" /NCGR_SAMPLE_ID=MMETSP0160_2 /ASSEMBLY_ACC=CAM_ASM_000250 /LENGTH=140 /DNA_ID=CAMNT_0025496027 /DNA_START=135 /DNA_END=557 /DNA_ORIENTATION=+